MTSWIDGSFIYSTSEAWVNAMRSFHNGTFLTAAHEAQLLSEAESPVPVASATSGNVSSAAAPAVFTNTSEQEAVEEEEEDEDEAAARRELSMPPKNRARVPLFNSPAPHVLRMFDPERLYCEYLFLFYCIVV
jgi:hypothetical protein